VATRHLNNNPPKKSTSIRFMIFPQSYVIYPVAATQLRQCGDPLPEPDKTPIFQIKTNLSNKAQAASSYQRVDRLRGVVFLCVRDMGHGVFSAGVARA
jgi:hypothetical protein